MNTCKDCKYFRVPDDGQEWGWSGVCDNQNNERALVCNSMEGGLAEDLWTLPCGTPVVREFYYCDYFEDVRNNVSDCF